MGVLHPQQSVSFVGELFQGARTLQGAPNNGQEVGDRAGKVVGDRAGKEVGDRAGKEVGDLAGKGGAYANLGCAYYSLGDYAKAIEYLAQSLAIAKDVGNRAGEGQAYAKLGCAYWSQGNFNKAIEYHTQHLAIAKEVGGGPGVWEPRQRVSVAEGLFKSHQVPQKQPITTRSAWR